MSSHAVSQVALLLIDWVMHTAAFGFQGLVLTCISQASHVMQAN